MLMSPRITFHKLRYLVQLPLAQQTADARDAHIPRAGKINAIALLVLHGAELVHGKIFPAHANALLNK